MPAAIFHGRASGTGELSSFERDSVLKGVRSLLGGGKSCARKRLKERQGGCFVSWRNKITYQ